MKLSNSLLALGLLLFALVIHGCYKPKVYPINSELKKAFVYKPGSYWIYKDSISGRTDSLYVAATNYSSINTGSSHPSPDQIEHIQIELHQVNTSNIGTNDSSFWTFYYEYNMIGVYFMVQEDSTFKYINYLPLVNYPFISSITLQEPSGFEAAYCAQGAAVIQHLSYTCPAGTFNEVAQMHRWGSGKNITIDDYFDLSADAGFVRMDLTHDSTRHVWELQRYHIVK